MEGRDRRSGRFVSRSWNCDSGFVVQRSAVQGRSSAVLHGGRKFKIPVTASGAPAVRLKNQFSPDGFVPVIRSGLAFHLQPGDEDDSDAEWDNGIQGHESGRAPCMLADDGPNGAADHEGRGHEPVRSATLVTRQPNLLCLPSWKGLTGPPMKTPTTPPGLSHFTCYPVGVASGAYKPPAVGLRLKDEFSAKPVAVTVNPMPQELCVPTEKVVGKRDYKILDPATHLLCFGGPKTPIKPKVWTRTSSAPPLCTSGPRSGSVSPRR